MKKLEVAFSPDLYPFYENKDAVVVVIDIFRATSAICTAFENGVEQMIPVEKVEQALEYKKQGYIVAAERKGQVVEGFQLGNSPFHYMDPKLKGETVVLTTTNGTRAIEIAKDSYKVVIGSFLNIRALCDLLMAEDRDVLLLCAGWKGRFNLEDSLFSGAVVHQLIALGFNPDLSDSARTANLMYASAKGDLDQFLVDSSHRKRLSGLNLDRDIQYCLQMDQTEKVPVLNEGKLVAEEVVADTL